MAYWDTSCLLKLYVQESDSDDLEKRLELEVSIATAAIARLELWAALRRKEAVGDIQRGEARKSLISFDTGVAARQLTVYPFNQRVTVRFEDVIDSMYRLTPHVHLRTLDAIHLSTALEFGETELVSTDLRLRQAALLRGLTVFPPQ